MQPVERSDPVSSTTHQRPRLRKKPQKDAALTTNFSKSYSTGAVFRCQRGRSGGRVSGISRKELVGPHPAEGLWKGGAGAFYRLLFKLSCGLEAEGRTERSVPAVPQNLHVTGFLVHDPEQACQVTLT